METRAQCAGGCLYGRRILARREARPTRTRRPTAPGPAAERAAGLQVEAGARPELASQGRVLFGRQSLSATYELHLGALGTGALESLFSVIRSLSHESDCQVAKEGVVDPGRRHCLPRRRCPQDVGPQVINRPDWGRSIRLYGADRKYSSSRLRLTSAFYVTRLCRSASFRSAAAVAHLAAPFPAQVLGLPRRRLGAPAALWSILP